MITFLEYANFSLILSFIFQKLDTKSSFTEVLESGKINKVQKIKLQNIFEIEQYISSGEGLFDSGDFAPHFLIDIQNIDVSLHAQYISKILSDHNGQVFIYSSELDTLNAETKKNLKKYKIEIETLKKIDPKIATQLYDEYCLDTGLKLSSSQIATLVAQSISYHEIIDNLDFILMANNPKAGYNALLKIQKPALFMQGFNLSNLDVMPWYQNVDENEIQLALSLIFGKLSKITTSQSNYLQKQIIFTDKQIKTSSKLPALTWFRLLLWKAKN